jgi:hypothetical protein
MLDANNYTVQNVDSFFSCQRRSKPAVAVQINDDPEGFKITNRNGVDEVGRPGDYLVIDKSGYRNVVSKEQFKRDFVAVAETADKRITYQSDEILPLHYGDRVLEIAGVEFSTMNSDELKRLDKGNVLTEKEFVEADEMPMIVYLRLRNKSDNSEFSAAAFTISKRGEMEVLNAQGKALIAVDRLKRREAFNPQPDPAGEVIEK